MTAIGQYNTLTVLKEREFGVFLDGQELGEILLPRRDVPEGLQIGDSLNVFLYLDSKDQLIATTQTPLAQVGQIAALRVKEVNKIGVFLDWGLPKDLLLPYGEQKKPLKTGDMTVVYVFLEERTERIAATSKLNQHLNQTEHSYQAGEKVSLIITDHTDIGYVAIINSQHTGVIYDIDTYRPLRFGQCTQGYIKNIRPDGKINLLLQQPGFGKVQGIAGTILKRLKEEDGYIAVNDKSAPALIAKLFGCSKKAFKMAIGSLYKQRIITIEDSGIRITEEYTNSISK